MRCTFCDVPKVEFRGNATMGDMRGQLMRAIELHPDVSYTERLNIHFARMGEPIFNRDVFRFARWLADVGTKMELERSHGLRIEVIHPVLTTSMPRSVKDIEERLAEWVSIKNDLYRGQAGLQISINSTSEGQRAEMFGGMALTLKEIADACVGLHNPVGRKYCLNFALATGFEVDAPRLRDLFDPGKFMVKITPIHMSTACRERGIETTGGYESFAPYREAEESLVRAGFDVIVFVPSVDEENGLVTCGNAVLGGGEFRMGGDRG
jgi:23S rRNA (adenine2503-C2)-methyltransferase